MGRKLPRPSPNPCAQEIPPLFLFPPTNREPALSSRGVETSLSSHWTCLDSSAHLCPPHPCLAKAQSQSTPPPSSPPPPRAPPFYRSCSCRPSSNSIHHWFYRSPLRAWRVVGQVCQRSIHKPLSCPEGDRTQFSSFHKKDPYPPYPSRPLLSCRFSMAYRHRDLLHPQQP